MSRVDFLVVIGLLIRIIVGYLSVGFLTRPSARHRFYHYFIRALWRSELSARVPECQENYIWSVRLVWCDPDRFGRLIFATIRKIVGLKELILLRTDATDTNEMNERYQYHHHRDNIYYWMIAVSVNITRAHVLKQPMTGDHLVVFS